MKDKLIVGALFCLIAGVTWGAQFPIAGSALKLIDPFYFTLLRYMAVSLILVLLLIVSEGTKALRLEGRAKWVWFYGTMAFTVYNFLVFLGQKTAGPSGAVLASIMMALMPITSVIVVLATIAGYLKVPAVDTLSTIRWEMGYMIVISGVLAAFGWNAGNRALTPINGILFINLVPVTTFVISILSGYHMSKLEVVGAVVTIAALVSNNLYQRTILHSKSAVPAAVPAVGSVAK